MSNFWQYTFEMNQRSIKNLKTKLHQLKKQKTYLQKEFTLEAEKGFRILFKETESL